MLIRKQRSYAEIYNDLDGDVVNLFRVLRSPDALRLIHLLRLTPFARQDFEEAYVVTDEPIEAARRLIVRSFMGFGSNGHARATGFRANSNRSGTTPAHDWANYPECLGAVLRRLRGVVIENRDAKAVMSAQDGEDTLHYVDPPYVFSTRADLTKDYRHELTDADHMDLLAFLRTVRGMVVLSGYPCELYDDALRDWRRIERPALADGARERTEVLWINPAAVARSEFGLFGAAA